MRWRRQCWRIHSSLPAGTAGLTETGSPHIRNPSDGHDHQGRQGELAVVKPVDIQAKDFVNQAKLRIVHDHPHIGHRYSGVTVGI